MATAEYKATLDASGTARSGSANLVGAAVSAVSTAHGSDMTAVDNAVSTLVADGSSPTQAHVTTLNTAWTTLKADIAAANTAASAIAADVSVYIGSTANVNSLTKLKAALDAIFRTVQGSDLLVP